MTSKGLFFRSPEDTKAWLLEEVTSPPVLLEYAAKESGVLFVNLICLEGTFSGDWPVSGTKPPPKNQPSVPAPSALPPQALPPKRGRPRKSLAQTAGSSPPQKQRVVWGELGAQQIQQYLQTLSRARGTPLSMLGVADFQARLPEFGGRTLYGLYQHYQVHPHRGGRDVVGFMLERLGLPVTTEDVFAALRADREIVWSRVPPNVVRALLEALAQAAKRPLGMLRTLDFRIGVSVFNGRRLGGLLNYAQHHPSRAGRPVMAFLSELAGIAPSADEVLANIAAGRPVLWASVSWPTVREVIAAAAVELGIAPALLSTRERNIPLRCFGGRTLASIYTTLIADPARGERDGMGFILERAGFKVTGDDVWEHLRAGHSVGWSRVPWPEIRVVIQKLADATGLTVGLLRKSDFSYPISDRQTLDELYAFANSHPERGAEEFVLVFLRRKAGFRKPNLAQSSQRLARLHEMLRDHIAGQGPMFRHRVVNAPNPKDALLQLFLPWIDQAARLYQRPWADLHRDELKTEAVLTLSSLPNWNWTPASWTGGHLRGLVAHVHRKWERLRQDAMAKAYQRQTQSLSKTLGFESKTTLGDVVADTSVDSTASLRPFSSELEAALQVLDDAERRLVVGITVQGKSFSTLALELGRPEDDLEEVYDDVLAKLRKAITRDV
ncbi:MAG: hypothetical protein ACKVPX_05925 [Myxococcaceae bacterium]